MPGDDRTAVRVGGVVLLSVLATVALRGVLPGASAPAAPPESETAGSAPLIAVAGMLTVSLAAIAVAVLTQSRRTAPSGGSGEVLRRDRGAAAAIPWRMLVIAGIALAAWLLVVLALMRWSAGTGDPPPVDTRSDAPTGQTERPERPAAPEPAPEGSVFEILAGAAIVLTVLSAVATVAGRARRADAGLPPADDPVPPPTLTTGRDLARAAERGLAEVGDLSRDPREAIIACYLAMEQELAKSPGTVPQVSDTPTEVLARAVAQRAAPADSAARLVDLFEEARFSPHVMTERHRADAVAALQQVRRERTRIP